MPPVPPTAEQATKEPGNPKKSSAPRPSRRRRRLVTLSVLGFIAAAIFLRPRPAGTLVVYAMPNVAGNVTVDGSRAGLPGEHLQVPVGTHRLGYVAEGWTTAGREITVIANEQRAMTVLLSPEPAVLRFDVQMPDVTLRLDDRMIYASAGETKVAAGRHRLVATRPGFTAFSQDLVVARGERRSIPIALSPVAVREVTRTAVMGSWSQPVFLPPRTSFTMAAAGRLRLRVGQDVVLVQSGSSINLGDVRGQSLQVKAVDDQSVDVHFYLKPDD